MGLVGSRSGSVRPSDAVSLEQTSTSLLSERFGFFRARKIYFGCQPAGGGSLWSFYFRDSFEVSGWMRVLERFLWFLGRGVQIYSIREHHSKFLAWVCYRVFCATGGASV